jgi:hypothetical protein
MNVGLSRCHVLGERPDLAFVGYVDVRHAHCTATDDRSGAFIVVGIVATNIDARSEVSEPQR